MAHQRPETRADACFRAATTRTKPEPSRASRTRASLPLTRETLPGTIGTKWMMVCMFGSCHRRERPSSRWEIRRPRETLPPKSETAAAAAATNQSPIIQKKDKKKTDERDRKKKESNPNHRFYLDPCSRSSRLKRKKKSPPVTKPITSLPLQSLVSLCHCQSLSLVNVIASDRQREGNTKEREGGCTRESIAKHAPRTACSHNPRIRIVHTHVKLPIPMNPQHPQHPQHPQKLSHVISRIVYLMLSTLFNKVNLYAN